MIALAGYEIRDNRSHVQIQALSLMDYFVQDTINLLAQLIRDDEIWTIMAKANIYLTNDVINRQVIKLSAPSVLGWQWIGEDPTQLWRFTILYQAVSWILW